MAPAIVYINKYRPIKTAACLMFIENLRNQSGKWSGTDCGTNGQTILLTLEALATSGCEFHSMEMTLSVISLSLWPG